MERSEEHIASDDTDDTDFNDEESVDIVSTNCDDERRLGEVNDASSNKFSINNILGIGNGKNSYEDIGDSTGIQKCTVRKVKCLKPTPLPATRNTG